MTSIIRHAWSFNRVLAGAILVSLGLIIVPLVGMMVDPKVITGANAWSKPLKFAIASTIYGASFLWLLTFVEGRPRLVRALGDVTGFVLVLEVMLILLQVIRGTTSHFNAATPFDAAVFSVMGTAISTLAGINLVLGLLLVRQPMPNRVFAAGLRFGVLASFLGMMVAFLMTTPTPEQLEAMRGGAAVSSIGAHSVGVPDGGPGLPFVGWSLTGGDLRVPHFVGIHGTQALALLGWLLTIPVARRRWQETQRVAFVRIGGAAYLAWVGLLTWQALRGQSLVAPDLQTWMAYGALLLGAGLALSLVAIRRNRESGSPQGGLELDELVAQSGPIVAEQSQRFVLDALPHAVGAVVRRDAFRREPSVPLPAVVILGEVDEAVPDQRPNVAADRRRVGADGLGQIAEGHASGDAEGRENRPLGAADARLPERVVVRGGQGAACSTHARPHAAHRLHDVDVLLRSHVLYMHLFEKNARSHRLIILHGIDE